MDTKLGQRHLTKDMQDHLLIIQDGERFKKAESKSTNDTSRDQAAAPIVPSLTTSNAENLKVFWVKEVLVVFKGWIEENGTAPVKPGTGLTVTVKTLNHDGLQGHKEWLAEVNFLGDLVHPNLVKLIGHCIEDDQRLLVYEFMP
ncbi:hypothetical protein ACJW30_05G156700 [Castanea mollissima]